MSLSFLEKLGIDQKDIILFEEFLLAAITVLNLAILTSFVGSFLLGDINVVICLVACIFSVCFEAASIKRFFKIKALKDEHIAASEAWQAFLVQEVKRSFLEHKKRKEQLMFNKLKVKLFNSNNSNNSNNLELAYPSAEQGELAVALSHAQEPCLDDFKDAYNLLQKRAVFNIEKFKRQRWLKIGTRSAVLFGMGAFSAAILVPHFSAIGAAFLISVSLGAAGGLLTLTSGALCIYFFRIEGETFAIQIERNKKEEFERLAQILSNETNQFNDPVEVVLKRKDLYELFCQISIIVVVANLAEMKAKNLKAIQETENRCDQKIKEFEEKYSQEVQETENRCDQKIKESEEKCFQEVRKQKQGLVLQEIKQKSFQEVTENRCDQRIKEFEEKYSQEVQKQKQGQVLQEIKQKSFQEATEKRCDQRIKESEEKCFQEVQKQKSFQEETEKRYDQRIKKFEEKHSQEVQETQNRCDQRIKEFESKIEQLIQQAIEKASHERGSSLSLTKPLFSKNSATLFSSNSSDQKSWSEPQSITTSEDPFTLLNYPENKEEGLSV